MKQYTADPVDADPKNYIGLEVINVTARFSKVAYYGFFIEIAILSFVLLGLALGSRIHLCSDLLGYVSLTWFIWLLFCRYDHFGKVCSGDFVLKSAGNDPVS